MLVERGVVIVGMEIEVPRWLERSKLDVAEELVEAGYMMPPVSQWDPHHKYHCECKSGGCYEIRRGNVMDPPLVSLTYDASLPQEGGEFIMSPVLLSGLNRGKDHMRQIWEIIVRDAEWRDDLENYHQNGLCSPSVHLHVSANTGGILEPHAGELFSKNFVMDAFSLFAPEFYALADVTEFRRKIDYRWPNRYAMMYYDTTETPHHHGFVDVRSIHPDVTSYIEWRLFEAAYNNWTYIEASMYMAAAITRGLLDMNFFKEFAGVGFSNPYNDDILNELTKDRDFEGILDLFDETRFYALRDMVLTNIDDEPAGQQLIVNLFEQVEERMIA